MPLPTSPAVAHDLAAVADHLRRHTVALVVGGVGDTRRRGPMLPPGHGSGIVWRADGLIVTNAHVARAEQLTAVLPDGRRVPARLVARDPGRDLALVRLEVAPDAAPLAPAIPGDPDALRPGQLVLAFGHPLGLANALAVGIVHASSAPSSRHFSNANPLARVGTRLIRADVRLLPGNSGGPLADASGRVVGVNTMVVGGLGVAVSSREVEALIAERAWGVTRPAGHARAA